MTRLLPLLLCLGGASALAGPSVPARGTLERLKVARPDGKETEHAIYLPPGYTPKRRYPAVYVGNGSLYFNTLKLPEWLDGAIAAGLPPVVAVGLDAGTMEETRSGAPGAEAFQRHVAEGVVGAVEKRYAVVKGREGRWLLGFSEGANPLVEIGARFPQLFSRVAAQSPGWMHPWPEGGRMHFAEEALAALQRVKKGTLLPEYWFLWGDEAKGWEADSRVYGARVIEVLRAHGARVKEERTAGGNGLPLLARTLPSALRFLTGTKAALAPLTVPTPKLAIPRGRTPKVDGKAGEGEWDDAHSLSLGVAEGYAVTVRVKHDGESLWVAFEGLRGEPLRVPEVLLDVGNDKLKAWGEDDWWVHASASDCANRGRFNDYSTCTKSAEGWEANNFLPGQEAPPQLMELRIPFALVGLKVATPVGLAFDVTDTRERWNLWPRWAELEVPATWAEATLAQ